MNTLEAKKIAASHLEENPINHKDYSWVVTDPRNIGDNWYFDYQYRHNGGLNEEEWEGFAGAPGFLINKISGEVQDISFEEYTNLEG